MNRSFYSATISKFNISSLEEILGTLSKNNEFYLEETQKEAWVKKYIF